ncbi:hypothetical protein L4D21_23455 [Photobacterium profundum]|uniref:hypothetical protein n=1 Tax=Photobacterium profundum TaxID=74109 RepID=UPI003D09B1B9
MKISVVELTTKNHSVMLLNWSNLCKENGWECNIITTKECYDIVRDDLPPLLSKTIFDRYSLKNFIKLWKSIKDSDFVVYNTVQSNFTTYLLMFFLNKNNLLTIHNSNSWFEGFLFFNEYIGEEEKQSFRYFFLLLRRCGVKFIRKVLLSRTKYLIVNSLNMKEYIESRFDSKCDILVIPFSLKQRVIKNTNEVKKTVVYPGGVDFLRKSYDSIIRVASDFPELDIHFLGRLGNDDESNKLRAFLKSNDISNVYTYDSYLSQEEFDRVMLSSDLLFSDINVQYRNEVYGLTKDSGVSYLMAEYGIPLVVNSDFNNVSCLNDSTIYYHSYEDLCLIFNRYLSSSYIDYKKEIVSSRVAISLPLIAKNIRDCLEKSESVYEVSS